MRLLAEQELQSIYGGNIFTSIWNWFKKHFTLYVENEPQIGSNGGVRGSFTILEFFLKTHKGEMQLNCISPLCHIFLFAFNLK